MSQNLQNFAKFQKFQVDNLVDFKNAAKRVFSCKNRRRYSQKRATFCRNFDPPERRAGEALPEGDLRGARAREEGRDHLRRDPPGREEGKQN